MHKDVSKLYKLGDNTSYKDRLVALFHLTPGPKSEKAMAWTFRLFVNLSAEEALSALSQNWNLVIQSGSMSDSTLTNGAPLAMPAELLGTVVRLCKGFARLVKSEAKGFA